ncbi:hypothetical protein SAE02_11520 [Skermanella aerolata]|uniref:DUF423 domain-containing protein n=1 Tax=Skermanella aerolata TaxID=393310 RepID=A0A512DKK4_9PROT|nr:DUF423 domain-containing protein [Skermanella aerolata]GEO37004.1 hypothetical protein SAE02_11520 [Skermanella aerolata]
MTERAIGRIAGIWLVLAALNGGIAVATGAYASHGLTDQRMIELFRIAGQYQMWHALALAGVASLTRLGGGRLGSPRLLAFAGWAFLAGIVLFCGALYLLALQGPSPLGAVAPVGGLSFMAGWAALVAVGVRWTLTDRR